MLLFFSPGYILGQNFIHYSYNEGFTNNQLVDAAEDTYGGLWFIGLTATIHHYDGKKVDRITLPDTLSTSSIFKILATPRDELFLFSGRGILRFDGDSFRQLSQPGAFRFDYGIDAIVDGSGTIWFMDSARHLFYMDQKSVIKEYRFDPATTIRSVTKGTDGQPLVLTGGGLLFSIDVNNVRHRVRLDVPANAERFYASPFGSAAVADDGITTYDDGQPRKMDSRLSKIKSLTIDRYGNIWVLSDYKLVGIVDHHVHVFGEADGLTDNKILQLFLDGNGYLWVMTDSRGLYRYKEMAFRRLDLPPQMPVTNIVPVNDSLRYITTYGHGIYLSSDDKLSKAEALSLLDRDVIIGFVPFKDGYLIGTYGRGLFYFDGQELSKPDFLSNRKLDYVRSIVAGRKVWIGTNAGAFFLADDTLVEIGNSPHSVNCFYPVSDSLVWIGTQSDGLFLYHNNADLRALDKEFYGFTAINVINNDSAGNLWVGGNKATASVYSPQGQLIKRIALPGTPESVAVIEFLGSYVIVSADQEIYSMKIEAGLNLASPRIYGRRDGFIPSENILGGFNKVADNKIWFGTTSGGYLFEFPQGGALSASPQPFITAVRLHNKDSDIFSFASGKEGLNRIPHALVLPYHHNDIAMSFSATQINSTGNLQCLFFLEGLDRKWSFASANNQVIYANLRPGVYTFRIKTISNIGVPSEETRYTFEIQHAFWQTPLFYAALFILVMILLVIINRISYHYKLRKYKAHEALRTAERAKLRQQMSMDFHDELGNKLASILSHASLLRVKSVDREIASLLEKIENNARTIYQGTRDFIWSIDIASNQLLEVLDYLRDFGIQLFDNTDVRFNVVSAFDPFRHARVL
ncbi:MAG TPA: triple tyrosine motif-containing protein, partial [Ohtaekwangia sp.]|nr:triple tyrosine motif-containing protein [Ohtaekwangia sp.]